MSIMDGKVFDEFLDWAEEQPVFDLELLEKMRERAELFDDDTRLHEVVFDVARHKGILGERYKSGESMGFYITYWPRYAWHPETKVFQGLGNHRNSTFHNETSVPPDLDDLTFTFEPTNDGGYVVSEAVTNESLVVKNEDEGLRFAESIVANWCLTDSLEMQEFLAAGQYEEYVASCRDALKKGAAKLFLDAWAERDDSVNAVELVPAQPR